MNDDSRYGRREPSWNASVPIAHNYLDVCRAAVHSDEVFKTFKSKIGYMLVLEHCDYIQGKESLDYIKQNNPQLLQNYPDIWTSDLIGTPVVYFYPELNREVSPTTLSYIKVLSDLIDEFGSLDNFNIVEIGGGYGGQCKIIYDVFSPQSYTIIDLPEPSVLQAKFLKRVGAPAIQRYYHTNYPPDIKYDLIISNYALTEVLEPAQSQYVEKVLLKSSRGYVIKNGAMASLPLLQEAFPGFRIGEDTKSQAKNNQIIRWGK